MKMFFKSNILAHILIIAGLGLISCNVTKRSTEQLIGQLRLVNVYEVPAALQYQGTTVGGLSGIDFDSKKDEYYLICDDRSDINPSRFYKARIHISQSGIDSVEFVEVVTLLDNSGNPYTSLKENPFRRIDPEGIRFNPSNAAIYWTNEGERTILNGKQINCDPSINIIDQKGQFIDSFLLPANIHVNSSEKGIRRNGAFEGLSFDSNYQSLFVSIEEPLYEDGPRAGLGDSTAWIRLIKFDVASRKPIAQYAYKIDAIPYPAQPAGAFKINGVPEILYLGENKMLVIERSFSTGRRPCVVKLYMADLTTASDVSNIPSLLNNSNVTPIKKELILNMENLGRYIDNIEGICLGPKLANGNQSLLLVSDDNFSETQKTQFFLFELLRR